MPCAGRPGAMPTTKWRGPRLRQEATALRSSGFDTPSSISLSLSFSLFLSLSLSFHISIHICMHTFTYAYIHLHLHIHIYICIYVALGSRCHCRGDRYAFRRLDSHCWGLSDAESGGSPRLIGRSGFSCAVGVLRSRGNSPQASKY